jgi:hypothetical protein
MAVRTPTLSYYPNGAQNTVVAVWTGLLNGDTGLPVDLPEFPDKSFQITGTFGAGGSVNCEGSNDGTNYLPLTDPQGNAITKTATAIEVAEESTRYTRPNVTAGDGTTSLTVTMVARRPR